MPVNETEEFLAHFGVKGMRWGVRRDERRQQKSQTEGGTFKERRESKKDFKESNKGLDVKRGQRSSAGDGQKRKRQEGWQADIDWLHNNTGKVVGRGTEKGLVELRQIHKTKYGGQDMTKAPNKLRRRYNVDAAMALTKAMNKEANTLGASPTGKIAIRASALPDGTIMIRGRSSSAIGRKAETVALLGLAGTMMDDNGIGQDAFEGTYLSHTDEITLDILELEYDARGLVVGVKSNKKLLEERRSMGQSDLEEDLGLTQSALNELDEFLAHVGVKGMKWGVRKSREERRAARTLRVQEKAVKNIEKQEQYTARAKAKEAAAKAKTETADARASAATAKLESKLAKDQERFAKKEARSGHDDPINDVVTDKKGNLRDVDGLVGKTDRDASKQRANAAKGVRTLDDATLKAYTQRLDTEKKLKQAIAEDQNPRKTAAKKIISDSGKELAKKALVGAGSAAVFYLISTKGGKEPWRVKGDAVGAGKLLSGAPKSSGKDAFVIPNILAGPPPSLNSRKARPF